MSAETRAPGRPRLFDEDAVLETATEVFWAKGYANTSVADLVEATGVHKPSLYRTFGTKEEIFAAILRRYVENRLGSFARRAGDTAPGVEGIHEFLTDLEHDLSSGAGQRGCLLVASSSELCGTTPSFEGFGPIYREALRESLRPLVAKAGGGDELIAGRATVLATWLLGLDVSVRGAATSDEIGRSIDAMRATVETWRVTPGY